MFNFHQIIEMYLLLIDDKNRYDLIKKYDLITNMMMLMV